MQTLRTSLLAVALLAFTALTAAAQVVPAGNRLGANDGLRITWPAAVVSADGLDAPSGYRVKAVSLATPSTVIRSWDAAANVTTLFLTPAMVPSGGFLVTVHPFNEAGEAAASNTAGPFGRASIPKTVTGVSAVVAAGEQ
jgi:hypothetical protein